MHSKAFPRFDKSGLVRLKRRTGGHNEQNDETLAVLHKNASQASTSSGPGPLMGLLSAVHMKRCMKYSLSSVMYAQMLQLQQEAEGRGKDRRGARLGEGLEGALVQVGHRNARCQLRHSTPTRCQKRQVGNLAF